MLINKKGMNSLGLKVEVITADRYEIENDLNDFLKENPAAYIQDILQTQSTKRTLEGDGEEVIVTISIWYYEKETESV